MFDHTNGTIITTQSSNNRESKIQMKDYKKRERIMKMCMDLLLFVGFPIFIIMGIVNTFFDNIIYASIQFGFFSIFTIFLVATFVKLFFIMKRYHNYEFSKNKNSMLIFFFQTLFCNIMTLFYYVMVYFGIKYNYPIPAESLDSCNDKSYPFILATLWVVYVPGIKCRLWVIAMAYFVINIK